MLISLYKQVNLLDIEQYPDLATEIKLQLELNEEILSKAVHSFIEYKVEKLANRSFNDKRKPEIWKYVKDHLLTNTNGTFLWVALVCEDLAKVGSRHVLEKIREIPPGLENIYERMMSQVSNSDDSETCKSILGVATTGRNDGLH
ncbi:WD40 repeat-like protein [Penicillium cf. viridicatum]|uniref:WD40 repeat-like protein n=1 Tax=Penicillium cf. viridicatum TaxID=2972119 RepID=A0A9W9MUD9_9EURO|nr:WD40 repeat-like protein [Penicillium cf. viridicatum]